MLHIPCPTNRRGEATRPRLVRLRRATLFRLRPTLASRFLTMARRTADTDTPPFLARRGLRDGSPPERVLRGLRGLGVCRLHQCLVRSPVGPRRGSLERRPAARPGEGRWSASARSADRRARHRGCARPAGDLLAQAEALGAASGNRLREVLGRLEGGNQLLDRAISCAHWVSLQRRASIPTKGARPGVARTSAESRRPHCEQNRGLGLPLANSDRMITRRDP